jgi:ethanolamine ammonia-lyase small subunit
MTDDQRRSGDFIASGRVPPEAWSALRRFTPARIATGRAGGSRRTRDMLEFRLAHASAQDAVHAQFDVEGLSSELRTLGIDTLHARSEAGDLDHYLRRPDLGRVPDQESRARLRAWSAANPARKPDVAIIVADGLSPAAVRAHGVACLRAMLPGLKECGLTVGPVVILERGRVAAQDVIGSLLDARIAVTLIGERPGLQSADSMGAYFVYEPRGGRTDAERNCVSNIRAGGLDPGAAGRKLALMLRESLRRQISGVSLKDEGFDPLPAPGLKG